MTLPEAFDDACATLETARVRRGTERFMLLIDGRSGSGKTSFTQRLSVPFPEAQIVHLDDLYPGWDGLTEGVGRGYTLADVWAHGKPTSFVPTQWPGMAPRQPVRLSPDVPLIIEGVGALHCRPKSERGVGVRGYFIAAPTHVRKERALARDGRTFAPHWESWARQEDQLLAQNPHAQPDVMVESAPTDEPGASA